MTETTTSEASGLRISVDTPSAWNRKLTITVPAERVRSERERVVAKLARKVRRPGFRKGHVPRKIVERDFQREIDRETVQQVVERSFRAAVDREGLEPITEGAIEIVRYAPDSDLVFEARFDVRPEIKLPRLGGFTIRRQAAEVLDEEVAATLDRIREAHAIWRGVERAPVMGDKVAVLLTPLEGAEPSEPRRYEFRLGEGQAIPDVERALLTLDPGAEGEFTVTYPEDFAEESRRGTSRRIRLRLEGVWEKELPALDEALAKQASEGELESLDDLRARIAERIRAEKEAEERERIQNEILDRILEANPFDVPESMVDRYLDALLRAAPDADPESVRRVRERYRPAAVRGIKRTLVIQRVAEDTGFRATREEVDARVAEWAERSGRRAAELRRELERAGELQEVSRRITEEKVFRHLESLSKIE